MASSSTNITNLLAEGLSLHQAGQFAAAQQHYRNILNVDKQHTDALFLLGTSYLQLNDPHQGINFIQQALETKPNSAVIHINLANALQSLGKKSLAITHLEKAIEIEPRNPDAHFNLAVILDTQGLDRESIEHYQKAIIANPNHVGAINNLGNILQKHNDHDRAITCYKTVLDLQPDNVDAHYNLANSLQVKGQHEAAIPHYKKTVEHNPQHWMAYLNLGKCLEKMQRYSAAADAYKQTMALNPEDGYSYYYLGRVCQAENQLSEAVKYYRQAIDHGIDNQFIFDYLGLALSKLEKYEEAVGAYDQAIARDPNNAKIYLRLGDALQQLREYGVAVAQYEKALQLNPRDQELLNNVGCALGALNEYDEAIRFLNAAISIKPNYIEAYNNLGCTLMELNKLDDAIVQFNCAIRIKPDYKDAHWNKGLAYLCKGKLAEGWPLYEYRPAATNNQPLTTYEQLLDPKSKQPKKLLVESEQGFGDIIQILRYINVLTAKGIECYVKVPTILESLTKRSFPNAHVFSNDEIPADVTTHIALMSLPLIMKTFTEKEIPSKVPYLIPDPKKVKAWKSKVTSGTKKSVGIFWRGKHKLRNDNRSLSLDDILPLFKIKKIQFIVLQKDITTPEFIELQKHKNVTLLEHDLIDFDETAAVMANLDLMISICSSPVHLSGALGLKTWGLLPFSVDWRWMMDRNDSPWYPHTKLFRQKELGQWGTVVKKIESALTTWANK